MHRNWSLPPQGAAEPQRHEPSLNFAHLEGDSSHRADSLHKRSADSSHRLEEIPGEEPAKLPRKYDESPCEGKQRAILLGASNSWFPVILSALSIPSTTDKLGQLAETNWAELEECENARDVRLKRRLLKGMATYTQAHASRCQGFNIQFPLQQTWSPEN